MQMPAIWPCRRTAVLRRLLTLGCLVFLVFFGLGLGLGLGVTEGAAQRAETGLPIEAQSGSGHLQGAQLVEDLPAQCRPSSLP